MRFLAGTDYVSDGGVGWFFLYAVGALPLGVITFSLEPTPWGLVAGFILVTYWWWPSWVNVARRAVKPATPPFTPKEGAAAQAERLAEIKAAGASERAARALAAL